MLLAIETSCDETAVALCQDGHLKPSAEALASQMHLHRAYGGVVPELAAREHLKTLPHLVNQVFSEVDADIRDVGAVAVTIGPGLQGCLLVGVSFAKAVAAARRIPLIPIHHIEGHIAAIHLQDDEVFIEYPAIALIVSGGHTMLVRIDSFRQYTLIAETRDDAAGEAFDKIASLLGLPYPGGPSLAEEAEKGDPHRYAFPVALVDDLSSFSFSGLKTAVARSVDKFAVKLNQEEVRDLAASAEWAIVRALVDKTRRVCERHSARTLVLTGGVAANAILRRELELAAVSLGIKLQVPPRKYCTDNAAMIGVLAQQVLTSESARYDQWKGSSNLGPDANFEIGPRARWPFDELCDHARK